jgi:hypothetical protein
VDLEVFSLAERPELREEMWSVPGGWPEFMLHSPVSIVGARYERATELFPELHLIALQGDEIVGRVHAVPIRWPGVDDLSPRGWDWALETGVDDPPEHRAAVSLIEARVSLDHRGEGLSATLLRVTCEKFRELGTVDLVGPVRPNGKADEPRAPISEYAARTRDDGLPADPWLRVHVRLGGRIAAVAPLSMTIPGTLAEWREWTGLPFDTDGLVDVEGGVVPVMVDTAQDHAVYVEPNVWVHHRL